MDHRPYRNDARDHDDSVVLHDHRVHSDLRQLGTSSGGIGRTGGRALHWRLKFVLAAGNGLAFRSHRAQAVTGGLHSLDARDCVSCNVVARSQSVIFSIADRGTLAVVFVRQLQRRHGGFPD